MPSSSCSERYQQIRRPNVVHLATSSVSNMNVDNPPPPYTPSTLTALTESDIVIGPVGMLEHSDTSTWSFTTLTESDIVIGPVGMLEHSDTSTWSDPLTTSQITTFRIRLMDRYSFTALTESDIVIGPVGMLEHSDTSTWSDPLTTSQITTFRIRLMDRYSFTALTESDIVIGPVGMLEHSDTSTWSDPLTTSQITTFRIRLMDRYSRGVITLACLCRLTTLTESDIVIGPVGMLEHSDTSTWSDPLTTSQITTFRIRLMDRYSRGVITLGMSMQAYHPPVLRQKTVKFT
ncbi:hypothetical protein J6590_019746 [Homalodisca vitripennis]|nr:hypothetical protein J6590_019746 [Homalodisca vitripennis]